MRASASSALERIPEPIRDFIVRRAAELAGLLLTLTAIALALSLATWSAEDPSINYASSRPVGNLLGTPGAVAADLLMQILGLASIIFLIAPGTWGWRLLARHEVDGISYRVACWLLSIMCISALFALLPVTEGWPLPTGLGGVAGDAIAAIPGFVLGNSVVGSIIAGSMFAIVAVLALKASIATSGGHSLVADEEEEEDLPVAVAPRTYRTEGADADPDGEPGWGIVSVGAITHTFLTIRSALGRYLSRRKPLETASPARTAVARERREPYVETPRLAMQQPEPADRFDEPVHFDQPLPDNPPEHDVATRPGTPHRQWPAQPADRPSLEDDECDDDLRPSRVVPARDALKPGKRVVREAQPSMLKSSDYELPAIMLLAEPKKIRGSHLSEDALEQNARLLEGVLEDFGVRGEIINVRPGPVVTLYELEPAAGIKSSRVIGLADDIARSMSAISARVAVVQGRNAIGIELPNQRRETVFLRELLASEDFEKSKHKLAIALGKTIGGEPVIVDLAKMPHLLVAGTTGSGKSVAINTMILSLLYRLRPDQCKLIMVDPKMLELSVYDGIPHLLTPVVTDPKKAVVALKWAVREMEDRYKKMSKLGVRNIDGFNAKVAEAKAKGKPITRTVQTGYDHETGEAIYEHEELELAVLPYIVIIVDEMADLMMVAGKDIEGAIQRLAQMARAAGLHLIMATQRPSVDVITGTIKANFPTRVSFQVTSKIDSRTILGEQGAEQLLGQGDMLYMAGGGRISRTHGPFVSDDEVEKIVLHLKAQGQPEYLEAITAEDEPEADSSSSTPGSMDAEESMDLYDRAVAIVLRDRKCSTSYIQRRLSVGYNKAASLVERMEQEGVVSPANHAGKREILVGGGIDRGAFDPDPDE